MNRDQRATEGPRAAPPSAPDLALFGLDDPGDAWVSIFQNAAAEEPPTRVGDFEVFGEAGRGGQGVVYRARCTRTNQPVALKRLDPMMAGPESAARLQRELATASALDHPAIVRVREADVGDQRPLLAMEWVQGVPFTQWADACIGRGESIPRESLDQVLCAFAEVCDTVRHAHQRGVIHRDLKPSNILVEVRDGIARPRLLDFGLARRMDRAGPAADSVTRAGEFVGTLAFAAPELIHIGAGGLDARSDIYALGVVLYRAVTGRMPFETDVPLAEAVRRIEHEVPPAPSSLRRGVDHDLDAVTLKALAKRLEDRYQSVDALAADIRRVLKREPVEARAPGPIDRMWMWARRRRELAAVISIGVLIAACAGIVSTILAVQLAHQRGEALAAGQREAAARRDAEQATAFLRQTLATAHPAGRGPDADILDLLADAAARVEVELADQPRVAAEVLYTVGFTYRSLWKFSEAIPHLERALELSREHFGPETEQTARCQVALGTCLSNTSDPRAAAMQESALKVRRAFYTGDHPLIAESLMRHGYALYRSPPTGPDGTRALDWDAAAARMNEALEMYRRLYGEAHRDTGSCLHNIAYMHTVRGVPAEAEHAFAAAVAAFRAAGNPRDPYYAECLTGYSPVLARLGRTQDALAVTLELIPLSRELYGQDAGAEQTMRAAGLHMELGDHAAAAILLEPLVGHLPIGARELSADQAFFAARLAVCWFELGRTIEAAALMDDARSALVNHLGPEHARTRQAEAWWRGMSR